MRSKLSFRILIIALLISCLPSIIYSQATCTTAVTLTPSVSCNTIQGDLQGAVHSDPIGSCGGATATTTKAVWFTFTATSSNATITLSNFGSNLSAATTYIELLNGTCPTSFSVVACQTASTALTTTSLTPGSVYYVRVYVTGTTTGSPTNRRRFDICLQSSPNDNCTGATSLTSNTSCTNTAGTFSLATASTVLPAGCEPVGTHYDVWYSFVALTSTHTVTLSSFTAGNPAIQLYSGSCGSLTSLACGTTSVSSSSLTAGATYYVRVSNVGTNPGAATFNICVTNPSIIPGDECTSAISLTSNSGCINTSATLVGATASGGIPTGCASAGTHYDVWFSFVATRTAHSITFKKNTPSNISNSELQLFSGTCGSLTSLQCGTTSIAATGLTIGATYYVRVSQVGGSALTTRGGFDICLTHAATAPATVDYSKSYVNITKGTNGGTIDPGDTLEIRATFVVRSGTGTADSLAFYDTLSATEGLRFIPGSLALRTNEGKIYKSFSDGYDSDAGWKQESSNNPLDTTIQINFGANASNVRRGSLTNTSRPSVFGSTCIIMATYRVVVTAGYSTVLNLGGGALTLYNGGNYSDLKFNSTNVMVYQSPGLCPNAVSPSNALGAEFNGTFGSGTTQNRAASPYTSYNYMAFNPSGPNDYYYGIANNTSTTGTTVTTWAKPNSNRVHNVWDISGDHTGATNPLIGNAPTPVGTNGGYMLVINSAYRADTAFTYTVGNLCPSTYYELSAWFKNICYKCGCDSLGTGASSSGYIPTAPGDSSGVRPNIAFDVDGIEYYTTGDILYQGLSGGQTGSDAANRWVKRGFTYLTGPTQTSFTLTLRNNAPGGGGNDWALDDIAVATCLPNMQYSPTLNPYTCAGNDLLVRDTIRSYFNNYANYKWQRSTDGGLTWSDVSANASATPVWNGSAYEFVTSYTIPPTNTNASDSGNRYRVIVATTSGNLTNTDCQVTDGVSQITLSVGSNCFPLAGYLLTFNGKAINGQGNLFWTTNKENEQVQFEIEKSIDGINFIKIGTVRGLKSANETNYYSFTDTALSTKSFYRISLVNASGRKTYSRIIQLQISSQFLVSNVTSYFQSGISLDVNVNTNSKVELVLSNSSGSPVKSMTLKAYNGTNNFIVPDLDYLAAGVYILQVRNGEKTVTIKTIKR